MTNINVTFSLELLKLARIDAAAFNVKIPKRLTAMQASRNQWFVQGLNDSGMYVNASNAYEARAEYINKLVAKAHPQLKDELTNDACERLNKVLVRQEWLKQHS